MRATPPHRPRLTPAPPPLTPSLSPHSLFILSNETVNIWSHLLGFLLFFTLGIYDLTAVLPAAGASREDFVICSVCLFCFQVGAGWVPTEVRAPKHRPAASSGEPSPLRRKSVPAHGHVARAGLQSKMD